MEIKRRDFAPRQEAWALILAQARQAEISVAQPHLLYLTDEQSKLYELATSINRNYSEKINSPISDLLLKNMNKIFDKFPRSCDFIDLGPGCPDKSLIILEYLSERGDDITYYPVDVSPYFLRMAVEAVSAKNIQSFPLQCRFEAVSSILNVELGRRQQRVLFLGFTFNNFEPADIVSTLAELTRLGDSCLICVQPATGLNEDMLVSPYLGHAIEAFAFGPLRELGFAEACFSYRPTISDGCVKTTFVVNQSFRFRNVVFEKGQTFVTAKSYRLATNTVRVEITKRLSIVGQYCDPETHVMLMHLTGKG